MTVPISDDELQLELQSIEAIFPNEIHIEPGGRQILVQCAPNVQLNLNIPPNYPSVTPSFEIYAPSVSGAQKQQLRRALDAVLAQHWGEELPTMLLYPLIEKALDFFAEHRQQNDDVGAAADSTADNEVPPNANATDGEKCAEFFAGPIIEDRKSKFQAYVAKIESKDQVNFLLDKLKGVGKVARATHNPYAWRLLIPSSSCAKNEENTANAPGVGNKKHKQQLVPLRDCDDDAEHMAGTKLLQLLENMDVNGVLVLVSRYYGGRKLGPDRFKHICNAAREAMILGGFYKEKKS